MPFVTVQLGQCGNQLGAAWFDTLAAELGGGCYGPGAADAFFQQHGNAGLAARAVLVDMEPKVIYSAKQRAAASAHGWAYARCSSLAGQSGSGNNWALGHNKYGPAMAEPVLDLVRRQVEGCDTCEGFLMLQSMAGGTGAGVGSFLAEAIADAYGASAQLLNCCVWPYESGEVTVQPYNTLLSMSVLAGVSSGILLLQNEVLHATCTRLLGIKHPGFKDLNAVAARGLASAMLPCRARSAATASSAASSPAKPGGRAGLHASPPRLGAAAPAAVAAAAPASPSWGSPSAAAGSQACGLAVPGQLLAPLADLTCHLFSHPSFRLASVRCVPQVPAGSMDFTTFTWPAQLRRLRAMALAGVYLEENLSGFIAGSAAGEGAPLAPHKYKNKAAASLLVLRGADAGAAGAAEFADAGLFAPWAVDPLLVAAHPAQFAGCPLTATLLATDQSCVAPLARMLGKAYAMQGAGVYLHQYAAHGLGRAEFDGTLAAVEDVLGNYGGLG